MNAEKKASKTMKGMIQFKGYLEKWMSPEEVESIWKESYKKFVDMLNTYPDVPRMVALHVYDWIFPDAAIYLSLKEVYPQEKAYEIIQDVMAQDPKKMGEFLTKCTKIPGFKKLFLWLWVPGSHLFWGKYCGFVNKFYPLEKKMFKMDIFDCPYRKYTTLLGCPEINRFFCDIDVYSYGFLPGMSFDRKQTLATGGDYCDFKIVILDKEERHIRRRKQ